MSASISFAKGHGLGNDYIVLESGELPFPLSPARVARICDRHRGIGGDGILLHTPADGPRIGLRIYNPDGTEAEKSGNGLRIFAAYLHQLGRVGAAPFDLSIMGGAAQARAQILGDGRESVIQMGRASFAPEDVPTTLPGPRVLEVPLKVGGQSWSVCAVGIGNPHCVLFVPEGAAVDLATLGPLIEHHPAFPRRTNVQVAQVLGPHDLHIRIWERGAGLTQASGSSSSAAAAAAVATLRCQSPVTVHMAGGTLGVEIDDAWEIALRGPAEIVAWGRLGSDLVAALEALP